MVGGEELDEHVVHGITGRVILAEQLLAAAEHHGAVLGVERFGIEQHGQGRDET